MSQEKKDLIAVLLLMLLLLTIFVLGSIAQSLPFDDGVSIAVLIETVAPPIDDGVLGGTPEPAYLD